MTLLYIITGLALLISVLVSLEKTVNAVKIGLKKFLNILPALISMLIAVSVILYLIPDRTIIRYLGNENLFLGVLGASAICRIPMMFFEASFLGIEFTLVRLAVSLPLLVITSMLMGEYLTKRGYKIIKGK